VILGWRRLLRVLVRTTLLVVALVAVYVAVTFVQVWQASTHDEAQPAEAIVVLGAAQYNGRPSPVFQARLDHAAALYEQGLAPVIVVTGGRKEGDVTTEAAAAARYLERVGVPSAALRLEVGGSNSWESLAATRRILAAENMHDVILVSDPYHSYRIDAIADEVGLDAHVSPADTPMSTASEIRALVRETAAVSVGRIISYRRLLRAEDVVGRVREQALERLG
jgi:uncharacterized SAM-binding protein YcdF (DUF218 family)